MESLIVLRLLQGAFTGTTPAAQSLVSATVPEHRQGYALGMIVAAVNAGNMSGQFLGGLCAAAFSAANTFRIGGALLFISCLLVALAARENFVPPPPKPKDGPRGWFKQGYWAVALPVLLLVSLNAFASSLDQPLMPLFIRDLHLSQVASQPAAEHEAEVYRINGGVNGLASLAAVLGALWMGRVLDRREGKRAMVFAALLAAGAELALGSASHVGGVAGFRAVMAFGVGAFGSLLAVWLGRASTPATRGAVFGWSVTARALGWSLAPVAGGATAEGVEQALGLAAGAGTRVVFALAGLLFAAHIPFVLRYARRYPAPKGTGLPSVRLHITPPQEPPTQA
jgi:DHA1 family multidrug resistance protein-like MFS transporter